MTTWQTGSKYGASRHHHRSQTPKWEGLPTLDSPTSFEIREHWNELYEWLRHGQRAGEDIKEAMVRRAKLKYPSPPPAPSKKGIPLGGKGILGGVILDEDKIDAQIVADKKRALELQQALKGIDDTFSHSAALHERLLQQAAAEVSKEAHSTFTRFQDWCAAEYGASCLPTVAPQLLAMFIVNEAKDAAHARRLLNHIATIYKKLNPPPYEDALVKVITEAFREEEPKTH